MERFAFSDFMPGGFNEIMLPWMRLFGKAPEMLSTESFVRPFLHRVRQALVAGDLETALAFLQRAIVFSPDNLQLYLNRGELLQYGFLDYPAALKDFRHILDAADPEVDQVLIQRARRAIRDMVSGEGMGASVPKAEGAFS
jgi:tetratricopeptide (TPR) repeat protein